MSASWANWESCASDEILQALNHHSLNRCSSDGCRSGSTCLHSPCLMTACSLAMSSVFYVLSSLRTLIDLDDWSQFPTWSLLCASTLPLHPAPVLIPKFFWPDCSTMFQKMGGLPTAKPTAPPQLAWRGRCQGQPNPQPTQMWELRHVAVKVAP